MNLEKLSDVSKEVLWLYSESLGEYNASDMRRRSGLKTGTPVPKVRYYVRRRLGE